MRKGASRIIVGALFVGQILFCWATETKGDPSSNYSSASKSNAIHSAGQRVTRPPVVPDDPANKVFNDSEQRLLSELSGSLGAEVRLQEKVEIDIERPKRLNFAPTPVYESYLQSQKDKLQKLRDHISQTRNQLNQLRAQHDQTVTNRVALVSEINRLEARAVKLRYDAELYKAHRRGGVVEPNFFLLQDSTNRLNEVKAQLSQVSGN